MFIKIYLIALPVFLLIDAIWLGFLAKGFYAKHLGYLMKSNIDWMAAAIFYVIFIAGLSFFVIEPAIEKGSWIYAVLGGALFGLVAYATYDLTNQATIKDWPMIVTIADLAWGAFIAGSVSLITYLIYTKIF